MGGLQEGLPGNALQGPSGHTVGATPGSQGGQRGPFFQTCLDCFPALGTVHDGVRPSGVPRVGHGPKPGGLPGGGFVVLDFGFQGGVTIHGLLLNRCRVSAAACRSFDLRSSGRRPRPAFRAGSRSGVAWGKENGGIQSTLSASPAGGKSRNDSAPVDEPGRGFGTPPWRTDRY